MNTHASAQASPTPDLEAAQKRQRLVRGFPIVAFSIFAAMLGLGVVAPILPLYARDMGASGLWIGVIFGGYSASRAALMPLFGWLSDRRGRKIFLSIGLVACGVVSFGYVFATDPLLLTMVRILHGAASALVVPIANAWVGEMSPRGEEGKWMGYFNTAFFVGFGVGPLLGGVLADYFGMDSAFIAMGIITLVGFIVVVSFLPESYKIQSKRRAGGSFKEMGKSDPMKGLFAYRMMFELCMGAFMAFLPIFAGVQLGIDPTFIGLLVAMNLLLTSFLQIYTGRLADRFNRRLLLIGGSVFNFLILALIPTATGFWYLMVILLIRVAGATITMPTLAALTIEEGRKFGMGTATSILATATSIGMALGPILGGAVNDMSNVSMVFIFSAVMGTIGTVIYAWFSRKRQTPVTQGGN
ncbi:MAG: MFS transporter [Chloroflexota bacterium]